MHRWRPGGVATGLVTAGRGCGRRLVDRRRRQRAGVRQADPDHRPGTGSSAQHGNIRADDDRLYLVDFGLATSPRFDLSDSERDFAGRNAGHDAAYASMRLVNWLVTAVCRVPVPAGGRPVARDRFVRRCDTGDIPPGLPPPVAEIIARHAATAVRMNDFCGRLFDGDLRAGYPGSGNPVHINADRAS